MIAKRLLLLKTLARLGPRALKLAGQHRLRLRRGWYAKRFPVTDWRTEDVRFISPFVIPKLVDAGPIEAEVAYFSWDCRPLPEAWNVHPLTGHEYPKRHWSQIPMFAGGDIKWMWEPSRMDWVVQATRSIAAGHPTSWLMSELRRWREANRPNEGVNWACGQETSFRMFALMLLATVLQNKDRAAAAEIRAMLPQHAERVEQALSYAISQHNNHGLSETVALYLAGHALPDHPRAHLWRQEGRSWFIRQVHEQFSGDGWYAQHSHNYTRVALLDGLIAMRVAEAYGDPLPSDVIHRFAEAARLMAGIARDGRVPNYGSNDGANVLPIHGCGFEDFRPIIAAVLRSTGGASPFEPGPWDELSQWFGLPVNGSVNVDAASSREGGYYVLKQGEWLGAIRCHTYADRPAHADMLHLDLWFGNEAVLRDGGTYSYNDPDGIGDFLKSSAAHNAVRVDGLDQMVKGSRFLWLDWTESKLLEAGPDRFVGEHYGYRSRHGVIHRRSVTLDESVRIEDELYAVAPHRYDLSFRLGGDGWKLEGTRLFNDHFKVEFEGANLQIELSDPADEGSRAGLESTFYGRVEKRWAVSISWRGESNRLVTKISAN